MNAARLISRGAVRLGTVLAARGWRLTTAESCTAGGLAYAVTQVPGSSGWFERGFVTYSNESKQELLGVSAALIQRHGAVSEPVAVAMAEGALRASRAQLAIGITGIAGPGGGSAAKPVGTVCFAIALEQDEELRVHTLRQVLPGDRAVVRSHAIIRALEFLIAVAEPDR
jgi:nicotinamide-nucleotide amidase